MNKIVKTRVKSHVLEKVIGALMAVFGLAAILIFGMSIKQGFMATDTAMIILLLIVILAILAQTVVLIRIYEQHD